MSIFWIECKSGRMESRMATYRALVTEIHLFACWTKSETNGLPWLFFLQAPKKYRKQWNIYETYIHHSNDVGWQDSPAQHVIQHSRRLAPNTNKQKQSVDLKTPNIFTYRAISHLYNKTPTKTPVTAPTGPTVQLVKELKYFQTRTASRSGGTRCGPLPAHENKVTSWEYQMQSQFWSCTFWLPLLVLIFSKSDARCKHSKLQHGCKGPKTMNSFTYRARQIFIRKTVHSRIHSAILCNTCCISLLRKVFFRS